MRLNDKYYSWNKDDSTRIIESVEYIQVCNRCNKIKSLSAFRRGNLHGYLTVIGKMCKECYSYSLVIGIKINE